MKIMKKTLQLFAVTGSLFFLRVSPLQSQVTIGAGIEPVRAVLLDLKDNDPDGDNVTSKTGGLVLVRVKLKDINTLEPFIPDTDPDWTNGTKREALMKAHVGLVVYNLTEDNVFSKGSYVWDGEKWITFAEASIPPEPLNQMGTINPSTANNQDSYLMAKLALGVNQAASVFGDTNNAQLTVVGPASINGMNVGIGSGTESTVLGVNAMSTGKGSYNVAVGYGANQNNTDGSRNTAVGRNALWKNTKGAYNTAVGMNALEMNEEASQNTAVGYYALQNNTEGASNTAMGYNALSKNINGDFNTAVGSGALKANGTEKLNAGEGGFNTAVGYNSLLNNTTGSYNTAVGNEALTNNKTDATDPLKVGKYNTAVGVGVLKSNTIGTENTAMGSYAMLKNEEGIRNVALGGNALNNNKNSSNNTAVGFFSMNDNTAGENNTAVGYSAGHRVTGSDNTFLGYSAGSNLKNGDNNIAIGNNVQLPSNTNTDNAKNSNQLNIGNAIYGKTSATAAGGGLVSIGSITPASVFGGTNNAQLTVAGPASISGPAMINGLTVRSSGYQSKSTALGVNALSGDTGGGYNTAVGYRAMENTGTSGNNVAVGYETLIATSGGKNTAVGAGVLSQNAAGEHNTAVGYVAGNAITSGKDNTLIGHMAGSYLETGSNNIAIGSGVQFSSSASSNQLNIGNVIYGTSLGSAHVGIGIGTPATSDISLDVNGLTQLDSLRYTQGTNRDGKVLKSDASGYATWEALPPTATTEPLYQMGTTEPSTSNGQNSFLMAKFAVGAGNAATINGVANSAQLTVVGGDASINELTVGRGKNNAQSSVAVGYRALESTTGSASVTAVGAWAGEKNTSGNYNTYLGRAAGLSNVTGNYNTMVGAEAGYYTTGGYNTLLGSGAGSSLTSGTYNISIGYNVQFPNNTNSNQLNIGNAIHGKTSTTAGGGSVSIGKTAPDSDVKLDVSGLTQITGSKSFRYNDGNQANGRVLTSDANGMATWAHSLPYTATPEADGVYLKNVSTLNLIVTATIVSMCGASSTAEFSYRVDFGGGAVVKTWHKNRASAYNGLHSFDGCTAEYVTVRAEMPPGGGLILYNINGKTGQFGCTWNVTW